MNDNAPILLFCYKRLSQLQQAVSSLQANYLAKDSELFIFSDAAKHESDKQAVEAVRAYIRSIDGFKRITIHEAATNQGLATSIIGGVSKVIQLFGKAIVVEDDLILSNVFLDFMNQALTYYKNNDQVFSVSGFSFPLKSKKDLTEDSYFYGRAHSWGWATWSDRWKTVDWEVNDWPKLNTDAGMRRNFNKYGSDLFPMLKKYMLGKNSSWYIRFTYHQQKENKLTVYPFVSKVINNGFDDSATHCNVYNRIIVDLDTSNQRVFTLKENAVIDVDIMQQLKHYKSKKFRAESKLLTQLLKLGIIKQNVQKIAHDNQ